LETKTPEYKTVKQTADAWGVTKRWVNMYLANERIPSAVKIGNMWLIPKDATKPEDLRKNNRRQPKKGASAPDIPGESEGRK
jgi:hypothetical protein